MRPDREVKIVALCDVSGSMSVYAQVFVAFLGELHWRNFREALDQVQQVGRG